MNSPDEIVKAHKWLDFLSKRVQKICDRPDIYKGYPLTPTFRYIVTILIMKSSPEMECVDTFCEKQLERLREGCVSKE